MGCGIWREDTFRQYSRRMGRTVGKNGSLAGDMSNQEMFTARTIDPMLDPRDVMRECCDNEEHPATIPVILALDVTGSMGQAAVEVAKQLNIIMTKLYEKVKDVEFMVMGIGDLAYDRCPLQVSQFESDIRIAEQLDKVYFEFGGGGNAFESYTAAWYFGVEHVQLDAWKRGKKGIIITMGDEGLNPYLPGERLAEITGRPQNGDVETVQLYPKVLEKYDVYHIYVDHRNGRNESFIRTWKELMDDEHFRVVKIDAIADMIIRIVTARAAEDKRAGKVMIAAKQEEISW
ncbi:MAG: VWA domain-containing protein [Lachnospiraceae bacterium]|nr:VWA domain-containing protein [Lachnospiraceae bacterium]MBO6299920.1 VWA domain-containing protein [Lachnospiraceae bacterium]